MHQLPLAEFAYNNSYDATTSVKLFFAEKGFNPSIEAIVPGIPAYRSVPDVPDEKTWAEKLEELWAAIEQRWKKVTASQQKYTDKYTKPCKFEVADMVWWSGKNI